MSLTETLLREEIWCVWAYFQIGRERVLTISRWKILWQDTFLSMTYGRPPLNTGMPAQSPHHTQNLGGEGLPYIECMKLLCKTALDILQHRSLRPRRSRPLPEILELHNRLIDLSGHAKIHLKVLTACRSHRDHLEHWNFLLHMSYTSAELLRPRVEGGDLDIGQRFDLQSLRVGHLTDVVDAFLGLQNVMPTMKTMQVSAQNALSCALMLSNMRELSDSPAIRATLARFTSLLSKVHAGLGPSQSWSHGVLYQSRLRLFLNLPFTGITRIQ